MLRIRDLLLGIGLVASVAVGLGAYRAVMGPLPAGYVLLHAPALAIGPGLVLGAAAVGYHSRSRLGAILGGAAGAGLGGLHAAVAETAGVTNLVVMATGGVASGLAAYLAYRAILPPEPEGSSGDGGEDET